MSPYRMIAALLLVCSTIFAPALAADFRPPSKPFAEMKPPPEPDYNNARAWLVWPGIASNADLIPAGIDGKLASNPQVDVFFVHPTTYLGNAAWNAAYDEGGSTETQLTDGVLRYQTGVFNGCCRIYAPRYRQVTISAFLRPGKDSNSAYSLAYSDVARAFEHYLTKENRGRPFILASHSQGSLHATRLLQERVLGDAGLRQRLVAAYIVGTSLPDDVKFIGLPVCESARQTGCLVDWNTATALTILGLGRSIMMTYGKGQYQTVEQRKWLCVNPLTWERSGKAPASTNLGSLPAVAHGNPLPGVISGLTGAACERGRLVVNIPFAKRKGFVDPLTRLGSYHNHDYNLFYASVRQNTIDRVEAFLSQRR
jgi:hypothetical protein